MGLFCSNGNGIAKLHLHSDTSLQQLCTFELKVRDEAFSEYAHFYFS